MSEENGTNGNGDKCNGAKHRREAALIASLGIIALSGAAVGGLVYDLVINGNQTSLTQLGTLATLGLGGLLALSGGKKPDGGNGA